MALPGAVTRSSETASTRRPPSSENTGVPAYPRQGGLRCTLLTDGRAAARAQRPARQPGAAGGRLAVGQSVAAGRSASGAAVGPAAVAGAAAGQLGRVSQRSADDGGSGGAACQCVTRPSLPLGFVAAADGKTAWFGVHLARQRPAEEGTVVKKSCVPNGIYLRRVPRDFYTLVHLFRRFSAPKSAETSGHLSQKPLAAP